MVDGKKKLKFEFTKKEIPLYSVKYNFSFTKTI